MAFKMCFSRVSFVENRTILKIITIELFILLKFKTITIYKDKCWQGGELSEIMMWLCH